MGDIVKYAKALAEEQGRIPMEKVIKFFTDRRNLAKQFLDHNPIYFDKANMWWMWDHNLKMWKLTDEIDILNDVDDAANNINTINSKEKNEILEAIRQEGRKRSPEIPPKSWVQFKDTIFDIKSGELFEASPKYFITNPIPHKIGKSEETPMMDKFFKEWVGEKYVKTLYQILAYCCIPDYPIHRIFCFIGAGCNGKSQFLKLHRNFIGGENCCSTELDTLLTSRFEKTRLFKKLVCQMGETNFNEMSQTSLLKKLSGGDLIGFEFKRKNPFEAENYAKILIATNTLPSTTDKTIGFYRRWLILDFPNRFNECGGDVIDYIPPSEYNNLARKCLRLLTELLQTYKFHNEGSIDERAEKYEERSNPFEKFWKETTLENMDGHIFKFEFKKELDSWCKAHGFRKLSDREIKQKMNEKGIETGKRDYPNSFSSESKRYRSWLGIIWKDTILTKPNKLQSDLLDLFPTKGTVKVSYLFEQKALDPKKVDAGIIQLKRDGLIAEIRPGEFERI